MRVFVTGASGWIGTAVVPELITAGHQVVGLARSDASAAALESAGAEVLRADLDDLDALGAAAGAADGVIHLAFKHDLAFSGNFDAATDADRRAIETFGDALAGTGRPFVIASGLIGLAPGRLAVETDGLDAAAAPAGAHGPEGRMANARITRALAERGIRSVVLRLPPTVHGDGDNGFVPAIIGIARATGVSGYVGDGTSRWPAVHRADAARLFRLALEDAPAGSTLHAVGDQGVEIKEIAGVIGRHLDVPVVSIAPAAAPGHFQWLAAFLSMDSAASATWTCELLGWNPTHPGLLEDLDVGHYFRA